MQSLADLSPLLIRLAVRAGIVLLVVWAFRKLRPADTAVLDLSVEKRRRQAGGQDSTGHGAKKRA